MTRQEFINQISPFIMAEAYKRGYKYPSAIIAQACLESANGNSQLASKYHNYFGLKCGSSWTGASVNMTTKEEYSPGTLTTIKDNFRAYSSMLAGVQGYFDFISAKRYENLKTAISSYHYLELIKADGYATSSKYVQNTYTVVLSNDLLAYDNVAPEIKPMSDDLQVAIDIIADHVISGDFGNGHDVRKDNIYQAVRNTVNEKCKK